MSSSHPFQANHRLRQERIRQNWRQREVAELLGTTVVTVTRWEQGTHQPSTYFRVKLCTLFGKSAEELGFITDLEPCPHNVTEITPGASMEAPALSPDSSRLWSVPYTRNPGFIGREKILSTLHTRLAASEPVTLTQASALSGLGGIGKTQVAMEYAYRYALQYKAVFWLAAETTESFMTSLQYLAGQLQLPQHPAAEPAQMVAAIQLWLATHSNWLLIGDNVEDGDLLQTILPPVHHGAILLTTRRQTLGPLAEPVELPPMNCEEGVTLLLRRARLLNRPTTDVAMLQETLTNNPSSPAAAELVKLLEGLPLALDQAGAYIDETGCSVADYLQRCRNQRKQVLARRGNHGGAHPASVTTTLILSVGQVEQKHPAAGDLLRICAFLHPEAIPEDLLVTGTSRLGPVLEPVVADPYQFDLALAALRKVSLVTRHTQARTLSVHRLVQAIVHESMSEQEQEMWQQRAIQLLNAIFPEVTHEAWKQCEHLLPHVLTCAAAIPEQVCDQELAQVLRKAGDYLSQRAQYEQAESLFQRALRMQEHLLGPEHPEVARTLSSLALLSSERGKDEQAGALYERTLRIWERTLGPEHPEVACALNGLATLQKDQGKYELAGSLYARALRIWEQALGPEHPEVARALNGLAILQKDQGKYELASSLYARALQIRERALGPDHPKVAIILNSLAEMYRERGDYEKAEPLYQRALHIKKQALGPEHPDVAYPLNNLAEIYREQGKYKLAESLSQHTLRIWEQALGPEHQLVAYPLNNLAEISHAQGKDEQAESLFKQVLQIREQHLMSTHPDTAMTLNSLATLYREQGKYEQAEPLYQRALRIREQVLGREHPKTRETRERLRAILETIQNRG
ncbi:MAG: FxSxx-COOH system tetratricopeptide repeat protein [Chloroflexota bacterium]|nr:FxSxx-COOH system tetratricopeptide repeat protein [Chloroflexota bacterium]